MKIASFSILCLFAIPFFFFGKTENRDSFQIERDFCHSKEKCDSWNNNKEAYLILYSHFSDSMTVFVDDKIVLNEFIETQFSLGVAKRIGPIRYEGDGFDLRVKGTSGFSLNEHIVNGYKYIGLYWSSMSNDTLVTISYRNHQSRLE